MDAATEQKVMQSFYDRIFEMVTYTPTSGSGEGVSLFKPQTTLVQLDTDGSIDFDDYKNMVTPINSTGNLGSSEAFYRLIDIPGGIGPDYKPTTSSIGQKYKTIVDGANTSVQPSPKEKTEYDNVRKYLFTTVEQTSPLTGKKTSVTMSSTNYSNYQTYKTLYLNALSAMRQAFNTYNMSDPKDQREWEAQAPVLQGHVSTAWENWVALGDKSAVEEALAFLAASDNNVVANIISSAKAMMKNDALAPIGATETSNWYMCYGSPFTWLDPTETYGWMSFTLNSNYLYTSDSSYYKQTQGSAGSSFLGLISWGGSGGSKKTEKHHNMQGNNLSIACEMLTVTIERPWMNDALFKTSNWYELGQSKYWVSNGKLDKANRNTMMPVIPTAFVLVKNVSITANWTTQDSSALSTAVSSSGGFSFGPFHGGGSGKSGSTSSSSSSSFSGGTLSIPNPQIVAWVNEITPPSPLENSPSSKS